jgi:hypothetical protein
MTYPTYTQQALSHCNLPRLKRIAADLGVTPAGDKKAADIWVDAIIAHQSAQTHKVTDEQALAQAKLDRHIADQANTMPAPTSKTNAPEELQVVDISFFDKKYYASNKLIATITHDADNFVTQRWVVMVNGAEVHRGATPMQCHRYICTHYKDGSLPVQEEAGGQGAGSGGEEFSPLLPTSSTGNEIMVQIFHACEQHGLELLDDGIYQNNVKLGEVGCTEGNWWVIRASSEHQQKMACSSVIEAVRRCKAACRETSLLVNPVCCDELLDRAFDELTVDEWWRLLESEAGNSELIAA